MISNKNLKKLFESIAKLDVKPKDDTIIEEAFALGKKAMKTEIILLCKTSISDEIDYLKSFLFEQKLYELINR